MDLMIETLKCGDKVDGNVHDSRTLVATYCVVVLGAMLGPRNKQGIEQGVNLSYKLYNVSRITLTSFVSTVCLYPQAALVV